MTNNQIIEEGSTADRVLLGDGTPEKTGKFLLHCGKKTVILFLIVNARMITEICKISFESGKAPVGWFYAEISGTVSGGLSFDMKIDKVADTARAWICGTVCE